MAKERGIGLLSKLDFGPEYREDGGKTAPVEVGRFKYFKEVAKRRNAPLLTANLMFIITLIPVLVMFILLEVFGGVEQVAYRMEKIDSVPYLLSGIGFGASSAEMTTADVQLAMINVYYVIFAILGVISFIVCIAFGGMMHLSMKFIVGDSFISKKDNYGNEVPRGIKEYFKGIKRTWKEMSIAGAILLILVGGVANLFLYFVGLYWQNKANAGHWIMIIFAGIFAIFMLMFLVQYLPAVVLYDMSLKSKLKNSAIFTLQFFIQNLGMVLVFAAPIILASVLPVYISIIIAAIVLVYGSKWFSLLLCNYGQYLSEKIITPVYNARTGKASKSKKKKK